GAPIAGQPTYEQQAADSASRMRSLRGSIYDEFASEVNKALRPPQVERLRALDLQWRGPLALADSSVAKAVGLSPEQAARASELLDQYHTAQLNVALASSERSPDPNTIDPAAQLQPMSFDELIRRRNLAQQKAQKVRDEASAKALALLTSAQKATWIRLLGKPFRFEGNGP
ncbi:MAG TPA: hypothetical protein VGS41_03830, partial [Chthonomonadales bacterium]|nr:hypothetical protein [Chthonomonadales bacterium]